LSIPLYRKIKKEGYGLGHCPETIPPDTHSIFALRQRCFLEFVLNFTKGVGVVCFLLWPCGMHASQSGGILKIYFRISTLTFNQALGGCSAHNHSLEGKYGLVIFEAASF
jgi:hypothetical protein